MSLLTLLVIVIIVVLIVFVVSKMAIDQVFKNVIYGIIAVVLILLLLNLTGVLNWNARIGR